MNPPPTGIAKQEIKRAKQRAATTAPAENAQQPLKTLPLIRSLASELNAESIAYASWKSNHTLQQALHGVGDLDLLVPPPDATKFCQIVHRLGFKLARAPVHQTIPGVLDYFGFDAESGQMVHLHVHFRLVFGDDRTQNYHLPIEDKLIHYFCEQDEFPIIIPEMEFILFVIRKTIKRCCWDAILSGNGRLSRREQDGLNYLEHQIDPAVVEDLLQNHLPFLRSNLFHDCLHSLRGSSGLLARLKTARRLQVALLAHTRRNRLFEFWLRAFRRLKRFCGRRLLGQIPKRRLATGGAMVAFVGGDGAGKSTAVHEVHRWLSADFATKTLHMGKPNRSMLSRFTRGLLKLERIITHSPYLSPGDLLYSNVDMSRGVTGLMIREVCRARDRYRDYVKARRFVNQGGIVICDRFPMSQVNLMDGPLLPQLLAGRKQSRLNRFLVQLEQSYYERILAAELIFVLKLDPNIAVARKTDENPRFVYLRSSEIWNLSLPDGVHAIDAAESKELVATKLKSIIWSRI